MKSRSYWWNVSMVLLENRTETNPDPWLENWIYCASKATLVSVKGRIPNRSLLVRDFRKISYAGWSFIVIIEVFLISCTYTNKKICWFRFLFNYLPSLMGVQVVEEVTIYFLLFIEIIRSRGQQNGLRDVEMS